MSKETYYSVKRDLLLQDVMPNLGRPLVRCDVWGLLRLYDDGHDAGLFSSSSAARVGSVAHNLRRGLGVCVECLIGKQNKPTLFKVTEPSSVPYRTPPACAKRAAYPDPSHGGSKVKQRR